MCLGFSSVTQIKENPSINLLWYQTKFIKLLISVGDVSLGQLLTASIYRASTVISSPKTVWPKNDTNIT